MPLLTKNILNALGVKNFSRGKLYGTGNSKSFTVIHTGVGPTLLGDAVLYLEDTPCRNIILFGSCGLVREVKDLNIGGLVAPFESYSLESFSDMLHGNKDGWKIFEPDAILLKKLLEIDKIKKVKCVTIGSLKLEEDYIDIFKEKGIEVADMECSALFSAAEHIKRSAIALFYITDIINKKPFYLDLNPKDRSAVSSSIKSAINILKTSHCRTCL
jgi:purine-nucleoside phosphorylase